MEICPDFATGRTKSTFRNSRKFGMSIPRSSRTGRRLPTRCKSFAIVRPAPFACCGFREPIPPSPCPTSRACAKYWATENLFVVVQDAFMTETAEFADVVLPTALWGEKTGCFTNVDRTVHISHKAIDPPGEAKSDLDIFLDFARRMDFRDKDSQPLIKWRTPEEAFEAWKACSRGRPCDYTGLSYEKLSKGSGIQWPCNDEHPEGEPRPYKSLVFPTDADYCETFGHDLITGGVVSPEKYRANNPRRARDTQAGKVRPSNRRARQAISVLSDDGPSRPSFPYPHQDRPRRETAGRFA